MSEDDPLIPVCIPALVVVLLNREREKGAPLTEAEVRSICYNAPAIMIRSSIAWRVAEDRGYGDLDPYDDPWEQWQAIRTELHAADDKA